MFLIPTNDTSKDPDNFTPQLEGNQNVNNQRNNQGNGNRGNQQRNGSNRQQGNSNAQAGTPSDRGNQQPNNQGGQGFNQQPVNGQQLSSLINLAKQVNVSQEQMEKRVQKPIDQWNANEYQKMKQAITSMLAGMNNNG